jgi:hypothetical protein
MVVGAAEALALYPYRWRIERMYFDLKEVLNLNRTTPPIPSPRSFVDPALPKP